MPEYLELDRVVRCFGKKIGDPEFFDATMVQAFEVDRAEDSAQGIVTVGLGGSVWLEFEDLSGTEAEVEDGDWMLNGVLVHDSEFIDPDSFARALRGLKFGDTFEVVSGCLGEPTKTWTEESPDDPTELWRAWRLNGNEVFVGFGATDSVEFVAIHPFVEAESPDSN